MRHANRLLQSGLVVLASLVPATGAAPPQRLSALAPVEVFAAGFRDARGVVVDAAGNVFISDADAGTITRVTPARHRAVIASGLAGPAGLALDAAGRVLIAEARRGRVLRLEASGERSVLAQGLRAPRWLTVDANGTIYVAARGLRRGAEPEPDDEDAEPQMILALTPAGRLVVFAGGLRGVQGLAAADGVLYAATKGRRDGARDAGDIVALAVLADGSGAAPVPLEASDALRAPRGLVRDAAGALFATAPAIERGRDDARDAVAKITTDGRAVAFASGLDDPQGLAFDADGNLLVAGGRGGRVVRFLAPAAPSLAPLPPFTADPAPVLHGATAAGARVDVAVADGDPASGQADAGGAFGLAVTLRPNVVNTLDVTATAHGGDGLTSSPEEITITHDGVPPAVTVLVPGESGPVRGPVAVRVRASDGGSGIGSVGATLDGRALALALAPAPPAASVDGSAVWDSAIAGDGAHTIAATATDRAGNGGGSSRTLVVDNTPPETVITGGPPATIAETTATLTFTGNDNLTPAASLAFAWRLDGGAWSPFAPLTSASLSALAPGPHTFEVRARDLAGNEDPTPASRGFSVSALSVDVTEPADGATIGVGTVLVRGTVQASGAEVGVSVNGVAAAVDGAVFAAAVPAPLGPLTLVATAVTATASAERRVSVSVVAPLAPAPLLLVTPGSGPAPLTVTFSLAAASPGGSVQLDADGDGTPDFDGPGLDGTTFTYTRPGVYVATATVLDAAGTRSVTRATVQVLDRAGLDAALQARWNALRDAVRRGDVAAAVGAFAHGSQDAYRETFTALATAGALPQVAADLGPVRLVQIRDGAAEYDLRAARGGTEYSFYVRFVLDDDGIWRLWAL